MSCDITYSRMSCEIPELKRCCFCVPLRYGLIAWVYFKLITTVPAVWLFTVHLTDLFVIISHGMNTMIMDLIKTAITIIVLLIDIAFSVIFLISAHRKNYKLMTVYYVYLLILSGFILALFLLALMYAIYVQVNIIDLYKKDHEKFIAKSSILFINIVAHMYVIVLVRSEIDKLAHNEKFVLEKNTAEDKCVMVPAMGYEDNEKCPARNNKTMKY